VGCSPGAVQKALRDGRIERNADGKITPEDADRAWIEGSDPARRPRKSTGRGESGLSSTGSLLAQKIEKETLEVALRRNKLDRETGRSVDLAALRPRLSEIHRTLRDQLLAIGQRVAADVLALEDMGAIAAKIESEIVAALETAVEESRSKIGGET